MAFKVNWPKFSEDFIAQASQQMTIALNKGQKPNNIVGDIVVDDLNMGTKPPDLEILEIGDLADDRFKGIFKMTYAGDAHVILNTKVQANPLNLPRHEYTVKHRPAILAANHPLVVPMRLRISNLKLRGIIVLVIDKHKGTTLVFKNDPLEKVDVNSTFDGVASVRRFLQSQIEGQLRQMFQEDLPMLIHKLSLVLIQQQQEALSGTAQAPNSVPASSRSSSQDGDSDSPPTTAITATASSNDETSDTQHKLLPEETVMKLLSRPHHQKWKKNEPVTILDSDSDMDQTEMQSVGAYVLHKSLHPESSFVGLEVVMEGLQKNISDSKMSNSITSDSGASSASETSSAVRNSSKSQNANPSPLSKITESDAATRSDLPAASNGPSSHPIMSNGLRIPVQTNHPINRFLSKTPKVEASIRSASYSYTPSLPESSYHEAPVASSVRSVTSEKRNRHSAPPNQKPDRFQRQFYSPSVPPSPRSLNIVQRSSISLFNEDTSRSSLHEELRGSLHNSNRYAPEPPRLNSAESIASSFRGSMHGGGDATSVHTTTSDRTQTSYNPNHQYHPQPSAATTLKQNLKPLVFKDRVTLQPSDNQVTAHLASLMMANHTISPVMHRLEHATFRTGTSTALVHTGVASSAVNLAGGVFHGSSTSLNGISMAGISVSNSTSAIIASTTLTAEPSEKSPSSPPSLKGTSHSLSGVHLSSLGSGHSTASAPGSARKKVTPRNVRKLTLPSGVPGITRSGSGLFGEPGIRQRTAGSAGRTSSIGSGDAGGGGGNKTRGSSLTDGYASGGGSGGFAGGNSTRSSILFRATSRVLEEDADAFGDMLVDRLEVQRSLRTGGQGKTYTEYSEESSGDEQLTIKSPPQILSGLMGRTASISAAAANGVIIGTENQPPRSTSSLSTRSAGSVATIKAKKVVRMKSNASGISVVSPTSNISVSGAAMSPPPGDMSPNNSFAE
ncbi:ERMES complex subunit [Chytriomyces hyalinus]|nr:ERMES complex subunit [Chytriomyces hyalinus]